MSLIAKIYHRIKNFLRRTYNLLYYLINKKDIIVITGWIQSIGDKVIPRNFGDDINYDLIKFLSNKKKIINICENILFEKKIKANNYSCIGSVASFALNSNTTVWGTGSIDGGISAKPQKICAVRGVYTRIAFEQKGVQCPEIYGDPALLLPLLYPYIGQKKYKYGLIPHYSDYNLTNVQEFKSLYKESAVVINLKNYKDWKDIVCLINQCEFIMSSSLHGLIVSDAYNIPNVWITLSNLTGGYYKFYDYFSGVKRFQKEPINLINNEIIPETIMAKYPYKSIEFDKEKFLNSCPFIDKNVCLKFQS